MRHTILHLVALLTPIVAGAAEPARPFASPSVVTTTPPSGIGSLGQVTLALALVLAVIFAAAWGMRRMRGFGKAQGAALDVVANLPLGQKERAVLIRCGNTQILLGVAPGRVNTLHVLTDPVSTEVAAPQATAPSSDFKAVLKRSLGL